MTGPRSPLIVADKKLDRWGNVLQRKSVDDRDRETFLAVAYLSGHVRGKGTADDSVKAPTSTLGIDILVNRTLASSSETANTSGHVSRSKSSTLAQLNRRRGIWKMNKP